jgi:hypothetical protein
MFYALDEIMNQVGFWGTPIAIVLVSIVAVTFVRRRRLLVRVPVLILSMFANMIPAAFIVLFIALAISDRRKFHSLDAVASRPGTIRFAVPTLVSTVPDAFGELRSANYSVRSHSK